MNRAATLGMLVTALLCASCAGSPADQPARVQPAEVLRIWPGQAPGTESWRGPEQQVDAELPNLGKVHIVTNVTVPTLTVVRPTIKPSGTAMIVVPGGAFRALPWDLDGLETARWLAARGITAFILKYRVRPPANAPASESFDEFARRTAPARAIAVADAEQAVRLVRARSTQYGIAPHRIGMIGFSAGAMTAMSAAIEPDSVARPDFVASLYGAVLVPGAPARDAPPVFIVAAQDDPQAPAARSVEIFERWTRAGLPAELHLYEKGGHGFAFRPHHLPSDRWPEAFNAWLTSRGLIAGRTTR